MGVFRGVTLTLALSHDGRGDKSHHGPAQDTQGDKSAFLPRKGNHKGCPYDGLAVAHFRGNVGFV